MYYNSEQSLHALTECYINCPNNLITNAVFWVFIMFFVSIINPTA